MSEGEQPWVECERLQRAYWDAIRRCAASRDAGMEEADRQRVAARDALRNFKDRACRLCARCLQR